MNALWLSQLLEWVPDDPFYQPRRPLRLPREMAAPRALASAGSGATAIAPSVTTPFPASA